MAGAKVSKAPPPNAQAVKDRWLVTLSSLVDQVETWAKAAGWATRRIEKSMRDREIGDYRAPAVMMQDDFVRILLEPLGHSSARGSDGLADIYRMPAYDDVARLYHDDLGWHIFGVSPFPATAARPGGEADALLTEPIFRDLLDRLKRDGD